MKIPQPKEKRKAQTKPRTALDRRLSRAARFRFRHSAGKTSIWYSRSVSHVYTLKDRPCRNCHRRISPLGVRYEDRRFKCRFCNAWNEFTREELRMIKYGWFKRQVGYGAFGYRDHVHTNMYYVP